MKLVNGSGSIVCLDKTGKKRRKPYAVRITTGWKDGKQVRKYIGYYESQAEAIIALAEYHKNGINFDLSKITLEDVYNRWIVRVEKKVSDSVMKTHKMTKDRLGELGKMHIKDIKTMHLQNWMDEINIKPSSKKKIKSTLNQIFAYAFSNDLVNKNYVESVEVDGKIEKTGSIFSEDEIAYLWKNSDQEIVQHILILIYTGLRIGELLIIDKSTIYLEDNYMVGGIKTEAGKDRVIPIHHKIKPFIESSLQNSKYIVHKSNGDSISYVAFKNRFQDLMNSLGWKHKIHDTRKTAVSIMHSSGIPMETVRIIVGHSGKGVTEQVYLYKTPQELVEAINSVQIL